MFAGLNVLLASRSTPSPSSFSGLYHIPSCIPDCRLRFKPRVQRVSRIKTTLALLYLRLNRFMHPLCSTCVRQGFPINGPSWRETIKTIPSRKPKKKQQLPPRKSPIQILQTLQLSKLSIMCSSSSSVVQDWFLVLLFFDGKDINLIRGVSPWCLSDAT